MMPLGQNLLGKRGRRRDGIVWGMQSLRSVIGVAAVFLLLTGCSSSNGNHDSATPTATPSVGRTDQKSAYVDFAKCMRANGTPNFPDPVQDGNGDWGFPTTAGKPVAPAACEAAFRQLRSVNQNLAEQGTHVDIAKLREFAKCMRDHGLSDFPDPTADGLFPLPGRYAPPNGSRLLAEPRRACPQGADVKLDLPRYSETK
jgi:hypothetical protein